MSEHSAVKRSVTLGISILVLAVSGGGAYLVTSTVRASSPTVDLSSLDTLPRPEPVNPFVSGTYLIAYVVASSDCGWSTRPDVMHAISGLRDALYASYEETYAHIEMIGISIDKDTAAGLAFLQDIESRSSRPVFDQVSVGGSWLNEHLVRLVWRGRTIGASIPSILLVERSIDAESFLDDSQLKIRDDDVVVGDFTGTEEISLWVSQGTPIRSGR